MLKRELGNDQLELLEMFLAIQINNLSETVNLDPRLNFQTYQLDSTAKQLIELFPVESLEDFVLCFKRGALGYYGTIYKLDASVLCEWMKKYLDEKYQLIEVQAQQLKKENDKAIAEINVDYEAYKKRIAETLKPDDRIKAIEDRERKERELKTPHDYYKVENLRIYATSQQHAEQIVREQIERGQLIRETK